MHLPTTDPGGITQAQAGVLQGTLTLQLPPQAPSILASACNCRAEIVPAQRTAAVIAANEKLWIIFLMIGLLSTTRPNEM
jgi:hypothetical protein